MKENDLNNIALLLDIWFVDNSWVLGHDGINAFMKNDKHTIYANESVESLIIKVWLHYYGNRKLWKEGTDELA